MGQAATARAQDSAAISKAQLGAATAPRGFGLLFKVYWPIGVIGGVNEVVLSLAAEAGKHGYEPLIAASQAEPAPVRGIPVTSLNLRSPVTEDAMLRPLLVFLLT